MNNTASVSNRLNSIDVIRCFAILSLVAWHSLCVYTGWSSRLPDITDGVAGNELTSFYRVATTVFLMPDANMPLFVIMAAFVYSFLWNKGAYRDIKGFLKKKIERLVIPYFVIGTLVVFTIADWSPISIIWGDAHHLWFCAMLFWCFVLIRACQKLPPPIGVMLIICGLALQVYPITYDFFGIVKGLRYFPYFIFGYYLYPLLPKFKALRWNKMIAVLIWIVTIASYFVIKRVEPICYAYCFMIFVLVPENIKVPNWVIRISEYSFGIYVFHEWLLWNAAHIDSLHPFIINHQVLYPLIAFILSLAISILLTKNSLKTKVGRFLLS